ncbi:hypothetical protein [Phorcysia thermohydrogeniphila]|uniref:Uncharacterized protein n=1 Tax=Phorcysia thermohydrogeniphila TaxID=936138 RepID=A0A4R1GAV2_9BACT|nr:hypothetical protein [Phorcysia thermohydrogeniphila]TCK05367.1 hypothetical protein CLV27_0794 [Phorcysia thermohydrogeniphila]
MDKEKSLKEYIREIVTHLEEEYPSLFFYSGSNDTAVLRDWYSMQIPLHFVLLVLSENPPQGRFTLCDIDRLVRERFKQFTRKEAKFALGSLQEETIPYRKLDKLYTILKSILLELEIDDLSIIERLEELKGLDSLKEIEEELINLEEKFYDFLFQYSPYAESCKHLAVEKLKPYRFYWHEKVYEVTERALIKKCLRKKHGIPEFTLL